MKHITAITIYKSYVQKCHNVSINLKMDGQHGSLSIWFDIIHGKLIRMMEMKPNIVSITFPSGF